MATSIVQFTPVDDIPKIVKAARSEFATHKTFPAEFRKHQLRQLYKLVTECEKELMDAVNKDLHKHVIEGMITELMMVRNDIVDSLESLDKWMAPEKPPVDAVNALDGCRIVKDPLGTVLIIGAWNYPIQLTLVPLIGAIAAGCCAIIKPSEVSPHTADALARLVPKYLDNKCYQIVNGAVEETTKLLEQKWDHIVYTGNGVVGRIVMAAAAKQLCPVTLELGGKSPTIVDGTCDLATVARRIAWGKFMNAGQTCIAPDYVIALDNVQNKLVEAMRAALSEFYTDSPQACDSYGRIVNANHFRRLKPLLESGRVVIGGQSEESQNYIAPTVLADVSLDSPVMKNEIFGPILPIVNLQSLDDAIEYINSHDKPLALYVFSNSDKTVQRVATETSSGGFVANDTLMHSSVPTLPFGGVGPSGMGAYHGKLSFDVFTHKKAAMFKSQGLEFVNNVRYPPYTESKFKLAAALLLKNLHSFKLPIKQIAIVTVLAAIAARVYNTPAFIQGVLALLGLASSS